MSLNERGDARTIYTNEGDTVVITKRDEGDGCSLLIMDGAKGRAIEIIMDQEESEILRDALTEVSA